MARRAGSPRHGLITGLGPVGVPISRLQGVARDMDDSYVASGHGDAVGYRSVMAEKRASPESPEQRAAGTVLGCR